MAYGNPGQSNPGPSDDMYQDAADTTGQPAEEQGGEETEGEGKTYVLPKEIMMGKDFKPGDEMVVVIKAIHDDQIEVAYAPEKSEAHKESEPAEEDKGAPAEAPGGMASMME